MATLLILLLSCVACGNTQTTADEAVPTTAAVVTTSREDTIELRVGATAPVPGTTSTITFVGVSSDSRCPKGVTCFWEGDAVAEVRVQPRTGEARTAELHANPRFEQQATVEGVTVRLERLDPYPDAARPVPEGSYVLTLRIGSK